MSRLENPGVLMAACAQPGCTGSVVDGYCDVCGSPAGAVPFVIAEAAASASSPVPAVERGANSQSVGGREFRWNRKTRAPITACTQSGCTGSIVDGYCDLCGSPAGAVPFVPAEAAASTESSAPADEPGPSGRPGAETRLCLCLRRRVPTQPIPRLKMPSQPSSTQELVDSGSFRPFSC